MEKVNGIVFNGRFYRALPMHIADLFEEMVNGRLRYTKVTFRMVDGKMVEDVKRYIFRFSPELTDLLAKPLCPEDNQSTAKKLKGE